MRRTSRTVLASFLLAVLTITLPRFALAQQLPAAIASDPAPDKANPAAMQAFQLPSHGALLNAIVYVAEGAGPHPVVVLLHGFPGNEKNLDLAQAIRRAGWDVLYFNYRGSWGSPGDFSFTHCIEDTEAAIAYLRDPANAKKLRADPAHIVLIGHSMGGFMANYAGAEDASIEAVGMISAANLGGADTWPLGSPDKRSGATLATVTATLSKEGIAPLAGCTPESLARDVIANQARWDFVGVRAEAGFAPDLGDHRGRWSHGHQRRVRRRAQKSRRCERHRDSHANRPRLLGSSNRARDRRAHLARVSAGRAAGRLTRAPPPHSLL
jgi:pimeloyl-ACP methyl ester carboxylesterase